MNKKTVHKSKLKEGYYWEYTPLYDALPDTLEVPEYQTEIFTETISHKEILDTYKITPYTIEQAFAVAVDCIPTLKNDWKGRIIYLKNGETLCRLLVCRGGDGKFRVYVDRVRLDDRWRARNGTLFGNTLSPLNESLSSSDSLFLNQALEIVRSAGYKIIKGEIV